VVTGSPAFAGDDNLKYFDLSTRQQKILRVKRATDGGGETRDGAITRRDGPPLHNTETIMFAKTTKTFVAALVLAGASISFVANASAAPSKAPTHDEINWMNRASGPDTGGSN
jgi:hypothetical protein